MAATNANVSQRTVIPFRTNGTSDLQRAINFTLRPNKCYWFEVKALAFRTQTMAEAASYWRQACYRTGAAGTGTLVGAVRTVVTDNEDAGGWLFNVGLSADSTQIIIDVASEGSPVDWRFYTEIYEDDIVQVQ